MRRFYCLVTALLLGTGTAAAQARTTLDIYVIDVEGGNATLFVTPSGESLLVDTGNGGGGAVRDAERILAAVRDAGLSRIDHLVTTHYHGDHYGAMFELAGRLPIGHFIDHGPNVQAGPNTAAFDERYPQLWAKARHTVARPGDRLPLAGAEMRVVMSAGQPVAAPLAGGGQNPFCGGVAPKAPDPGENAQSVGIHVTFGRFRTVHLGDLTWNKELELMCPANRLGTVDLFLVSHHGQDSSNSPALVHALQPRVAVMNNGTRKGGQPAAMQVLFGSPGLEDLYQVHFSQLSGQEHTVPGLFIANLVDDQPAAMPIAALVPAPGPQGQPNPNPPAPAHDGAAFWIKIAARQDGSFTVTNGRNGFTKAYAARP